jgi:translocation and assembly module TamB
MNPRARRWTLGFGAAVLVVTAAVLLLFETGVVEHLARSAIVSRIEHATGARVEMGAFHLRFFTLHAEMDDLTLHGREEEGLPPLFHADRIQASVRIISFFGRQIALDDLIVERPQVNVRMDESGRSNVPTPPVQGASRPWRERLFDLSIGKLRLDNGALLYNDVRIPLAVEGRDFQFAMDRMAPAGGSESYVGRFEWKQIDTAAWRYLPFRSDVALKFTLSRDAFSLDDFQWKGPRSEFAGRAELPSFARHDWNFHYRGRLNLADVRTILRKPNTPDGTVDFSGDGSYAADQLDTRGHYQARGVVLPYLWFHEGGMESIGRYQATRERLVLPEFTARAAGGTVEGDLRLNYRGLAFLVNSRARGTDLRQVFAALDHPGFPLNTLHWAARMDVDAINTWNADFTHFRSRGESRWSPPVTLQPGEIPATARIEYDYSMDARQAVITQSEISTPSSRLVMDGPLSATDSGLEVDFQTQDLIAWDDFINAVRGENAEPQRVAGRAEWKGRVLGPLVGPTFSGHAHTFNARYGRLTWDEIEGDMDYSPDEFRLQHGRVRRGRSESTLDLQLQFDGNWSFTPASRWSLAVNLVRAPLDDIQGLFGTSLPVHGLLTGEFHAGGTRAAPQLGGTFSLDEGDAWGYAFDHFRGELGVSHDEIGVSNAELRMGSGSVTGNVLYRPQTAEVQFALKGQNFPLEQVAKLQATTLPLGGRLDFDVHGEGPLLAPRAQGTLRLKDFRAGSEVVGTFEARLDSDGQRLRLVLGSEMAVGKLQGQIELGFAGDSPLSGEISLEQIDLDAFIQAGLHLRQLTGHSSVDGRFTFSGALRRPDSIVVQADISHISFAYESVALENKGPLRFSYRRSEIRIDEARLSGPNTDFSLYGYARFSGERQLNLNLAGTVNLQLATGLFPGLEARGAAQVKAAVEGTYSKPRITGRVSVADAAAHYGDFPTGLSHVTGELVFDRSRLSFDNVSAEAGGGTMKLSGSVSYGEGPMQYEVRAVAPRVRIRYPVGMSWLIGGTLQFSGTTAGATLSGSVVVSRLLMGEGVDLPSVLVSSQEPLRGPLTSSLYLRNLEFDIQAKTAPGARIEWSGANFETEGDLRVRGTWEHPTLIGNVHVLSGELDFRGNKYQLTRGDIIFSNPFRLDPVLNVEATTTISSYEITVDFTGPTSHLTLAYRSDPPLSASDVIALLALGSPGEQGGLRSSTSATPSQGFGATALLSEAISTQLGGPIQRLFGISRFRVDPFLAGTATEQNAAARVTIEQQITHDLTITYSTNATANQEQVIQVEYAVRRDVSIIALRDINGTFGIDIKFKKHFK